MRTNIEAVLRNNQAALDAIPWDKMANARLGWGFSHGFTYDRHYSILHHATLAKLFYLKGVIDAADGKGDDATHDLLRGLALYHVLGSDVMTDHLESRVGEGQFCQALQWVLNHTTISSDGLATLDHALADENPDGLLKVYLSRRCENIWQMGEIKKMRDRFNGRGILTAIILGEKLYRESDLLDVLNMSALKLPPKECFAELDRIKAQYNKPVGKMSLAAATADIEVDFSAGVKVDRAIIARIRVTRTAVEVERWRLAHGGRLPDSLAELAPAFVPAVPMDLFDNKPLRYKKLPEGYIIYSIGPDFTDDGGQEPADTETGNPHSDIVFHRIH